MKILEESQEVTNVLNEIFINVLPGLSSSIENSMYYTRLKNLLHSEIHSFTRERKDLKDDLNILRLNIGNELTETDIREYLDTLKEKYNDVDNNIALDYHIEVTKIDFGVPVFVVIKRDELYMKKFVFRFKKKLVTGIGNLTNAGIIRESFKGKENND